MHLLLYLLLHAQVVGVVVVDGLMCDIQIAYTQRAYIQHEESRYNMTNRTTAEENKSIMTGEVV